ncbi:hypothetical protein J6590_075721 [Homalodisca vitripennis]|nr:hypothetical protein J6590_075721 [Homalodisca vitripennis]
MLVHKLACSLDWPVEKRVQTYPIIRCLESSPGVVTAHKRLEHKSELAFCALTSSIPGLDFKQLLDAELPRITCHCTEQRNVLGDTGAAHSTVLVQEQSFDNRMALRFWMSISEAYPSRGLIICISVCLSAFEHYM